MAQTISSLKNTSTTVASSGSTLIYTATGNTRVIINGMMYKTTDDSRPGNLSLWLGLRNSGASAAYTTPIAGCRISGSSSRNYFMPGTVNTIAANSSTGSGGGGQIGVDAGNPFTADMYWIIGGSYVANYHYCPKSFNVSSGDTLYLYAYNNNGTNVEASYNFTLITES